MSPVYWGNIGMMENEIETTRTIGTIKGSVESWHEPCNTV